MGSEYRYDATRDEWEQSVHPVVALGIENGRIILGMNDGKGHIQEVPLDPGTAKGIASALWRKAVHLETGEES